MLEIKTVTTVELSQSQVSEAICEFLLRNGLQVIDCIHFDIRPDFNDDDYGNPSYSMRGASATVKQVSK